MSYLRNNYSVMARSSTQDASHESGQQPNHKNTYPEYLYTTVSLGGYNSLASHHTCYEQAQ